MKLNTQQKIAANLKMLRLSRNLKQADLAERLDIDRSVYALYENCRRAPDLDTLDNLCRFYGIRIELLMQSSPEQIVSEAAYCAVCEDGDRKILTLFRGLSLFSKGKLLEKAENLAEWDAFYANQREQLTSRVAQ